MSTRLITGLDLGATKLCATQAKISKEGRLILLGSTAIPSAGLVRGTVHKLDFLSDKIRKVILQIEEKTHQRSYAVVFNVSGDYLSLQKSQSGVFLSERGVEISQKDVTQVIESAQQISLPFDRQILHLIPLGYIIDGREGVRDPIGIYGSQLGVKLLILEGASNPIQSIAKAVYQAGLAVEEVVYAGLAGGQSLLTDQERELGTTLVDIGSDLTDISVFWEGNLVHAKTLAFGGRDLTDLIAWQLSIPWDRAEELKKVYGGIPSLINHPEELIRIRLQGGTREFTRSEFCKLLNPCIDKILTSIRQVMEESGFFSKLICGVRLTGGVALTEGLIEYAERFLGTTVKLGLVHGELGQESLPGGLFWGQSIGLVRYWANEWIRRRHDRHEKRNLIARTSSWARTLYRDYF